MKIVFDSSDKMDIFVSMKCPKDIDCDAVEMCTSIDDLYYTPCEECWKNCGVELVVESEGV